MSVLRAGLIAGLSTLVACGGGGGDTDPVPMPPQPPVPVNAAGLWVGSTDNGTDVRLLVDENLVLWGVHQNPLSLESAAVQGQLKVDEADATGSAFIVEFREYLADGEVVVGAASAKVVPESTLDGDVTRPSPARFSTLFDRRFYEVATLGAIQGDWQLSLRNAGTGERLVYGAMNVSTLGAVNGVGLAGGADCAFVGNLVPVPRRGGHYAMTVQFGASAECRMPGQSLSGYAILSGFSEQTMLSLTLASDDRWTGVSAVALPGPAPTGN